MINDIGGVWRTVGGRRIFIKDGQNLVDAMKESGKFSKKQVENKNEDNKKQIIDENTRKFSEKIMNQNRESAIVFDDNGKEIIFKNGEQYKVEFRGKELDQLKDMNLTHNHPTTSDYDSMFSRRDLVFAYDNDLKSISTINQKGDIIKVERDKSIKFDDNHKPGFFASDFEREKDITYRNNRNFDEVANHMDNWMKENAEKYGYRYERKTKENITTTEKISSKKITTSKKYSDQELYNMTSKQLATLLVEDQIKRGIIKPENKEMQIKARLNGSTKMSKIKLFEYAKKYL